MSSTYSKHLIGSDYISLPGFNPVVYDPTMSKLENIEASTENLINYLNESKTHRISFNESFKNNSTHIYVGEDQIAYINPTSNRIVSGPGVSNINLGKYDSPQFGSEMLNRLSSNNVDFAHYVTEKTVTGTSLETVLTTDGTHISVDPTVKSSTLVQSGFGAVLAGLSLPLIGYGIRNILMGIEDKDIKKGLYGVGQLIPSAFTNVWFGINLGTSIKRYASDNLVTSMLGLKGLCFNSGMFLIGNGAYNVISSFKDYFQDKSNKLRPALKATAGSLEIASGAHFVSAGTKAMTSLIYEGSGGFSISTKGLASILSTTIPWAVGLGLAALAVGAVYLYKWYKNKKNHGIKWLE